MKKSAQKLTLLLIGVELIILVFEFALSFGLNLDLTRLYYPC